LLLGFVRVWGVGGSVLVGGGGSGGRGMLFVGCGDASEEVLAGRLYSLFFRLWLVLL
jgi:hypothetical protein